MVESPPQPEALGRRPSNGGAVGAAVPGGGTRLVHSAENKTGHPSGGTRLVHSAENKTGHPSYPIGPFSGK